MKHTPSAYGLLLITLSLFILAAGLAAVQAQSTDPILKIAFTSNRSGNDDIWSMPASGGAALNLTRNLAQDTDANWSPDGETILFVTDREGVERIYRMSADGARTSALIQDGTEFTDIAPAWSPDGQTIVFVSNRGGIGRDLFTVDSNGQNLTRLTNNNAIKGDPSWSPDGQWIAYWELQRDGQIHIFKINVSNNQFQRLTTTGQNNGMPLWAPDGQSIYFDSDRDGQWGVYQMGVDGARPTRLTPPGVNSGRATIAPDGSLIAFVTDKDESDEIYTMRPDGSGLKRLTDNDASDFAPAWQPIVPLGVGSGITVNLPPTPAAVTPTPAVEMAAVGQSANFNGREIRPIEITRLNAEYGVNFWVQAGWTGAGVKVAVIDLGFIGLQNLETQMGREIFIKPGDDRASYSNQFTTHGTDVLEVINGIAPDAELYACRYDGLLSGLQACAEWLRTVKVDIINHSAGLPVFPLNGTNDWAQLVEKIYQEGFLWINSAGNFNNSFIVDAFTDRTGDSLHEFATGGDLLEVPLAPYSGNILLTWQQTRQAAYNARGDYIEQNADFDLQIVDLSTNQVIQSSERRQRDDANLQPAENLYVNAEFPWGIRIINAGQPMENNIPEDGNYENYQNITIMLFAEFANISRVQQGGSVIAPGDAPNALTVGSVQGIVDTIADYSSRGVQDTSYNKPDLSAPGEIRLADGRDFVGTSAASPVVAGMAALIKQAYPNYYNEDLRRFLMNNVPDIRDQNYGKGVIHLNEPELLNITVEQEVQYEPKTVFYVPEEPVQEVIKVCPGAQPTRLAIDAQGYVNYNLGLAIRSQPNAESGRLNNLDLGTQFRVLGGPVCSSRLNWWQVELLFEGEAAGTGWVAEGNDYYLISPRILERALLPTVFNEECPLAPPTQLAIGERAFVANPPPGGLSIWRSLEAKNLIGGLAGGTELYVLGGSVCEGDNENIIRWYVRVMDGNFAGSEGWVSEGRTGERWLRPS